MSYIKFEHRHLGDERWLDATPAAFVVHTWALDYCNEQATDGAISVKVAHRLNCPVEPVDLPAAWESLVALEWWAREGDVYLAPGFLAHGIAADEQHTVRAKWAADKRRRRLHNNGTHDLCTERSKCNAHPSTGGQVGNPLVDKWTTRPDPTRPDQTPKGSGSGGGESGSSADASSACTDCGLRAGKHALDCEEAVA